MVKFSLKLFGSLLLSDFFTLFFTLVASAYIKTAWLWVIFACVMTFLYLALSYADVWTFGHKDSINVKYRGKKYKPYMGLIYGLIINSPLIVLTILMTLCGPNAVLYNTDFASSTYYVSNIIIRVLYAPYLGFVEAMKLSGVHIYAILIPILPLVSVAAYQLGFKDIKLAERIIFKKKNSDNSGENEFK